MKFIMSNGSPACFAETREQAEAILGTTEIQEIPHRDLSSRDWYAAEAAVPPSEVEAWRDKVESCFAVAC